MHTAHYWHQLTRATNVITESIQTLTIPKKIEAIHEKLWCVETHCPLTVYISLKFNLNSFSTLSQSSKLVAINYFRAPVKKTEPIQLQKTFSMFAVIDLIDFWQNNLWMLINEPAISAEIGHEKPNFYIIQFLYLTVNLQILLRYARPIQSIMKITCTSIHH